MVHIKLEGSSRRGWINPIYNFECFIDLSRQFFRVRNQGSRPSERNVLNPKPIAPEQTNNTIKKLLSHSHQHFQRRVIEEKVRRCAVDVEEGGDGTWPNVSNRTRLRPLFRFQDRPH
jgi:hypothetical protein